MVTLCGTSSRTIAATAPDSARRAAWLWAKSTCGNLMKLTDMLTMRPKRRAHMPGATAWISRTEERKCTSSQCCHSSRGQAAEIARHLPHAGIVDQDVGLRAAGEDRLLPLFGVDVGRDGCDRDAGLAPQLRGGALERLGRAGDHDAARRLRVRAKARPRGRGPLAPHTMALRPRSPRSMGDCDYSAATRAAASSGANEPASRRGGTRKRPAMSFSCSRSVITSARLPLTSTVAGSSCAL